MIVGVRMTVTLTKLFKVRVNYFHTKNCTFCGKAFHVKVSLDAHVELVHKNVKPYLC